MCAKANAIHKGTKAIFPALLACVYWVQYAVGRENEIFLIVNVVEVELKAGTSRCAVQCSSIHIHLKTAAPINST